MQDLLSSYLYIKNKYRGCQTIEYSETGILVVFNDVFNNSICNLRKK